MFVPTHILDVVEGVCPVAEVALVHGCLLPGDHLIHHHKMLHVVTRRCLVTLRAFPGARGRMHELRNLPRVHSVAVDAFTPEEPTMRLSIAVTCDATKIRLFSFTESGKSEDILQIHHHLFGNRLSRGVGVSGKCSDAHQYGVVHLGRTHAARMLKMTPTTFLARRMKRRRLLGKIGSGCRMTGDAGRGLYALGRRMTGFAPVG